MQQRSDELEDFKTRINLTEYAAGEGFAIDRKKSGRHSAKMAHPSGEKIIIARGQNGHWLYSSITDPSDQGTVIDFVQNRKGLNLGQVRRELRPWLSTTTGTPLPGRPSPDLFVATLEPITADLLSVRARFETMAPIASTHPYLTGTRKIPEEVLAHDRFTGRIRIDDRSNAVFVHMNRDGVCGYELKNQDFTGFAPGGTKALWPSRTMPGDNRLVICESAPDCLAYAALFGELETTRFVSIAGQLNRRDQLPLLASSFGKMIPGSQIIAAMDHDDAGTALASVLEECFFAEGLSEMRFIKHPPPQVGDDWSDVLIRASMGEKLDLAANRPFPS